MSATRDQSQKFRFIYENMYALYLKSKKAAQAALPPLPVKDDPILSLEETADRLDALSVKLNGMLKQLQEINKE